MNPAVNGSSPRQVALSWGVPPARRCSGLGAGEQLGALLLWVHHDGGLPTLLPRAPGALVTKEPISTFQEKQQRSAKSAGWQRVGSGFLC